MTWKRSLFPGGWGASKSRSGSWPQLGRVCSLGPSGPTCRSPVSICLCGNHSSDLKALPASRCETQPCSYLVTFWVSSPLDLRVLPNPRGDPQLRPVCTHSPWPGCGLEEDPGSWVASEPLGNALLSLSQAVAPSGNWADLKVPEIHLKAGKGGTNL